MVTASDPKGPWSDPIPLNKMGFDPSLFHDPDGTKWLVNMLFDYRLDHKRFGGVGVQQYDPWTGAYIQCLGELNQMLTERADEAVEVIYSIPIAYKEDVRCSH